MTETAPAYEADDTVTQMLCLRNDELLAEKEALIEELERAKEERDEAFAKGKQAFDDLRRVEAERDALAAHVERLEDIIERSTLADSPAAESALEDTPETSLARLKAGWQTAAVETAVITAQMKGEAEVAIWLQDLADTFRRQAEGGE